MFPGERRSVALDRHAAGRGGRAHDPLPCRRPPHRAGDLFRHGTPAATRGLRSVRARTRTPRRRATARPKRSDRRNSTEPTFSKPPTRLPVASQTRIGATLGALKNHAAGVAATQSAKAMAAQMRMLVVHAVLETRRSNVRRWMSARSTPDWPNGPTTARTETAVRARGPKTRRLAGPDPKPGAQAMGGRWIRTAG